MKKKINIGLIDSGCDSFTCKGYFVEKKRNSFMLSPQKKDILQHGTLVAKIITNSYANFTCMQVFDKNLTTSVEKISFAIDTLCSFDIDLIHMSFGLSRDSKELKNAIEKANSKNIFLVASTSTTFTSPIYPASYEEVVCVSADARCSYDEISFLDTHALFGASPLSSDKKPLGSSMAAAHITKTVAKLWYSGVYSKSELIASLKEMSAYQFPQCHHKGGKH